MKQLLSSFSIQLVKVPEMQTESEDTVITQYFNAGMQIYYIPSGRAEALKSFSVVPSGFDVLGVSMQEHKYGITDILRYRTNG